MASDVCLLLGPRMKLRQGEAMLSLTRRGYMSRHYLASGMLVGDAENLKATICPSIRRVTWHGLVVHVFITLPGRTPLHIKEKF